MNGASVKAEPDYSNNINNIKEENASSPTAAPSDDDLDEAGDLDFADGKTPLWLLRLPKSLWENWSKLDDDEEFQIGMLRIEKTGNETKRISMRLDDVPQTRGIPKDYTLLQSGATPGQVAEGPKNTYVFSEKDQSGFVNAYFDKNKPNAGRSLLYEQIKRDEKRKANKNTRFEPYARKSIPKQTALAGKVVNELHAIPVENEEYKRITELKVLAQKPRSGIRRIEKVSDALLPSRTTDTSAFIATSKAKAARARDNKTIRMPQNELLDLIFDCFRRFKHWPFKSLKAELKQPEAYLKQTLEIVAVLIRSGDFASTWMLKPETSLGADGNVPDLPPPRDESDADAMLTGDDEEEEFENVA